MKYFSKKLYLISTILIFSNLITGCSIKRKNLPSNLYSNPDRKNQMHKVHKEWTKKHASNIKYQGHFKIGKPYKIKRVIYKPKLVNHFKQVGMASWYGCEYGLSFCKTANQDILNPRSLTAAHKTLPLPCMVKVTNLERNKSLIVMINDRGPFHKNRIIDVSEKASEILEFKKQGIAKVKIQYLKNETNLLLNKLSLKAKEHAYPHANIKNPKCSVEKYIMLVNKKHKLSLY